MTLATRIIPCLDVDSGRVVKGINFTNLKDAGDPVELALRYAEEGADEITFLDISASVQERQTTLDVVKRTAESLFIPLTVGGGIRSTDDVDKMLRAGADKVSINTAAISRPQLINEIAGRFGDQVLVLSVDVRRVEKSEIFPSGFEVTTHGGRTSAGLDACTWIEDAIERGVGEILLNSMDFDGTTSGFDIELISLARKYAHVPIIASGGAGRVEDFSAALEAGADALLAASVFHFGYLTIHQVRDHLKAFGYPVRR